MLKNYWYFFKRAVERLVGKESTQIFGKGRNSIQLEFVPKLKRNGCFFGKSLYWINEDILLLLFFYLTKPSGFYLDVGTNTLSSKHVCGIWIIQRQEDLVEGIFYLGSFFPLNLFELKCIHIWSSIWTFLFNVFVVLLFYFTSSLLLMYFNGIHLSRNFGSQCIFKSKIKILNSKFYPYEELIL